MDLLLHKAMEVLCENCRAIAYCIVKLLAIKVEELDVCGSLVLSNPVTHIYSACSQQDESKSLHIKDGWLFQAVFLVYSSHGCVYSSPL